MSPENDQDRYGLLSGSGPDSAVKCGAGDASPNDTPAGYVIHADGIARPGRLHDPAVRAVILNRAHELRHESGWGVYRIHKQLASEGWVISHGSVYNFLREPCPDCDGVEFDPEDFRPGSGAR